MKKYLRHGVATLAMGFFCNSAFAAGAALDGFDLTAGFGFVGTSSKETYAGSGGDYVKYGSQDTVVTLGAGYAHSFRRFNLGAHFSVDTGSQEVNGEGDNTYSYKLKIDKLWSVSLEPGVVLGDMAVAYLKLTHTKADIKTELNSSGLQLSGGDSIDDLAFGLGVRAQVATHMYVAAEVERYKFSEATLTFSYGGFSTTYKDKPEQTRATVKLGLAF